MKIFITAVGLFICALIILLAIPFLILFFTGSCFEWVGHALQMPFNLLYDFTCWLNEMVESLK